MCGSMSADFTQEGESGLNAHALDSRQVHSKLLEKNLAGRFIGGKQMACPCVSLLPSR